MRHYIKIKKDNEIFFVNIYRRYSNGLSLRELSWREICIYKEYKFLFIKFKKFIIDYPVDMFRDKIKNLCPTNLDEYIATIAVEEYLTKNQNLTKQKEEILETVLDRNKFK